MFVHLIHFYFYVPWSFAICVRWSHQASFSLWISLLKSFHLSFLSLALTIPHTLPLRPLPLPILLPHLPLHLLLHSNLHRFKSFGTLYWYFGLRPWKLNQTLRVSPKGALVCFQFMTSSCIPEWSPDLPSFCKFVRVLCWSSLIDIALFSELNAKYQDEIGEVDVNLW